MEPQTKMKTAAKVKTTKTTKKTSKKTARFTICNHCGKKITGKAKLSGLAFVCPYCGKPTGNGTPRTGYKWGEANNLNFRNPKNPRKNKIELFSLIIDPNPRY